MVPSASCYFVHIFYITGNQYQTDSNATNLFVDFFWTKRHSVGQRSTRGELWGEQNPPSAPGGPGAPRWVVPTSVASRTACLLYKYPNIPETLEESTKINSSCRKFQKHQIQYRHHRRGVHHVHWCLSDDAWVILCRPMGPYLVARWHPLSLSLSLDYQYNGLLEIHMI